ncbi:MAG: MFS transporter [Proteobacteria bacterium]|nr:MFS transporter [Pseudomonadota bacterium]
MLTAGARRYAMLILAVVYMFNFIDRQILAILLPAIRDEFQVGDTVLGLLTGTAFALFYVTLGIPIAQVADRWNRRNLVAAALAIWSGMTALSGLAANIWQLTLARIGVGIGEAGCSPPAHSMISDYYPPEQRSIAMGFYTLGISTGIMIAYLAGGWVVENHGWRQAFFIVGIPGLILAGIMRFTVVEPQRGASEERVASGSRPTFLEVLQFLRGRRSFIHMGVAAGLSSFVGYAVVNFFPSYVVRSFGMGLAELGFWLGIIVGIAGGVGYFGGGVIADKLGRESRRKSFNFLALASLVSMLFYVTVFLAQSSGWALAMLVLPTGFANLYLATVLAQAQSLVSLRMRAVASALVLLLINIIGLACGPLLTGMLSDALKPSFGAESIRYSLLIVCVLILPWAAWHYVLAGRSIDADLGRAREQD